MVSETSGVSRSLDRTAICFSRVALEKPRFKVRGSSPAVLGGRMSAFNSATGQQQDALGGSTSRVASPAFWSLKTPETVAACLVLPKS